MKIFRLTRNRPNHPYRGDEASPSRLNMKILDHRLICGIALGSLTLLSGCESTPTKKTADAAPTGRKLVARYTVAPVKVDGRLNDAAWKDAVVYRTHLGVNNLKNQPESLVQTLGTELREGGEVRLAWDDKYLYIGIHFEDSDVVAEGKADQEHHYGTGDVLEVFLKPENETWYWELYATPHRKKTSFFFPGRGQLFLPSAAAYRCDMKVGAQVDGTLNNWEDRDRGWTAEMAVPIKALTARGEKFEPGAPWRILVARYNYSRYLPMKELSMTPQLNYTNYHLLEEYGWLDLEK